MSKAASGCVRMAFHLFHRQAGVPSASSYQRLRPRATLAVDGCSFDRQGHRRFMADVCPVYTPLTLHKMGTINILQGSRCLISLLRFHYRTSFGLVLIIMLQHHATAENKHPHSASSTAASFWVFFSPTDVTHDLPR